MTTETAIAKTERFDARLGPGRVFFSHKDRLDISWVAYQPLENHVENVRHLLANWRVGSGDLHLPSESYREELVTGARYHDWGKPKRFTIKKGGKASWTYSYSGHRFQNPADLEKTPYHLALERAHHDYSVEEIVADAYVLRQNGELSESRDYPRDLYILEMCDQIEAEVAMVAIHGEARNPSFMEFEVIPPEGVSVEEDTTFLPFGREMRLELDPYPFADDAVSYQIVIRRDALDGMPTERELKSKGFDPYDDDRLITIDVTLCRRFSERDTPPEDIDGFYALATAGTFSPNELQKAVWEEHDAGNAGLIVKAPTGMGKTEACIYPLLAASKRVLLALPAKALVDDHTQRFRTILGRLGGRQRRLLIDTGDEVKTYVYNESGEESEPDTDTNHRHLYRADLIITTLDKMLYRFFGYGGGKKSYTYPLRMRSRERMAFVFDEAHSYEGTAFTNFQRLVTTLYDEGHNVTLMTATLPKSYQQALQDPEGFGMAGRWEVVDFLERADAFKKGAHYGQRRLSYLPDDEPLAEPTDDFEADREAFEQHKSERVEHISEQVDHYRSQGYKRLIVTLDRVVDAAEVYQRLHEEKGLLPLSVDKQTGLPVNEPKAELFLYHGRLDRMWRSSVYQQVKQRDTNGRPYILVSTSAIEIGVDLDAEVLITELCNPDALVQRMGRCNRHGNIENARVVVVGSSIPNYLDTFGEEREPFEKYLGLLEENHDKTVGSDFIRDLAREDVFPKPVLSDPRAATAYDMLYRYVYGFELEYRNLHELGFIATRSWEPSLDVRIPYPNENNKNAHHIVQVPVSRLSRSTDDASEVVIERYVYTERDKSFRGEWQEATFGGDLYRGSYRITLRADSELVSAYQADVGLIEIPRIFQRQRWKNDPPLKVRLRTWSYEREEEQDSVFFYAEESKKGKNLIFSYLATPELDLETAD